MFSFPSNWFIILVELLSNILGNVIYFLHGESDVRVYVAEVGRKQNVEGSYGGFRWSYTLHWNLLPPACNQPICQYFHQSPLLTSTSKTPYRLFSLASIHHHFPHFHKKHTTRKEKKRDYLTRKKSVSPLTHLLVLHATWCPNQVAPQCKSSCNASSLPSIALRRGHRPQQQQNLPK